MAMVWSQERGRFVEHKPAPPAVTAPARPLTQAEIYNAMFANSQRGRRQSESAAQAFTRFCQENPADFAAYRAAG